MSQFESARDVSDRELLIRIDERTQILPKLVERVDSLESDRDKFKALAWTGGGGGIVGVLSGIWHFFTHGPK